MKLIRLREILKYQISDFFGQTQPTQGLSRSPIDHMPLFFDVLLSVIINNLSYVFDDMPESFYCSWVHLDICFLYQLIICNNTLQLQGMY